ncbi:ABC transporter permease [Ignatzschineria sp. LJL83]
MDLSQLASKLWELRYFGLSEAEFVMSLELGLIYGIVGMGIYLTFRIIDFPDLTCDGSFVLGAAISSVLIKAGIDPFVSLLFALIGGAAAGAVTGILNSFFKVTDLLAGILVAFMLYSINLHVMNGTPNISLLMSPTIFIADNLIVLGAIAAILIAAFSFLLNTDLGLAIRAVGQNKRLCMNGGINVKWMVILGVAMGNALIAMGGALFSQQQGFTDISAGIGTIIAGFAAVIIGERILPFRSIWIKLFSCILGSIVYRIVTSLALHAEFLNLKSYDFNLIAGLLIIIIMAMPGGKRKC